MKIREVITALEEVLNNPYNYHPETYDVAVAGYNIMGDGCIGATRVTGVATDGVCSVYLHTHNKLTPVFTDELYFPSDDNPMVQVNS